MKNHIIVFIISSITILAGCSTTLNMSYDPAYIEKRDLISSNINFDKTRSILVLPYKDKRTSIKNPYKIYKKFRLDNQTLSEYLHESLIKDLKMMGFNIIDRDITSKLIDFKDIKKIDDPNINLIVYIEVIECIPDYIMNFATVQPYSIFDFNIIIFDNIEKSVSHEDRLFKKIMAEERFGSTFKHMVQKLLNEDLTIINVDIAEMIANQ